MISRISHICFILIPGLFAVWTTSPLASQFEKGSQQVHISNLHQINDDLYVWTHTLTVDGIITGDLVAGAETIDINGAITGSTNVFANSVTLGGTTTGSARAFARVVVIDGMVGGSVVSAAGSITLEKGGVVSREAHFFAGKVTCEGTVLGDLHAYGNEIILSGTVEGDAHLKGKQITVVPPAIIKGKLFCDYSESLDIDSTRGVIIGNGVEVTKISDSEAEDEKESVLTTVVMKTSQVLAAFLFGIIALALMPGYTKESVSQLKSRFSMSAATGVLSMAVTVLALAFAVIALICFGVGAILSDGSGAIFAALLLVISFLLLPISIVSTVTGAIIFYAGKIALAFLLGYLIAKVLNRTAEPMRRWHLLVGLIMLAILFTIPFVGTLLYLVVCTIGAGSIVLATLKIRNELFLRQPSPNSAEKL
ncbi:MAG: polymer-forming cytoskeletal protein [Candidatus Zixiibacteriota bacterium]